MHEPVGESLD